MARYALLNDDNKITNVVLADQTWIDGQTETYILDSNNEAQINGYYLNNSFIPASPFSSWTLVNNHLLNLMKQVIYSGMNLYNHGKDILLHHLKEKK